MLDFKVITFFREVKYKGELQSKLDEVYRKTSLLDFNPLNFVKWNENKVSEIIAFFLDPHAAHGQGDLYLKMFVEYFKLSFNYSDYSKVQVFLEENTDNNRRVDLVISYDNFKRVIGIENKIYPWTKDQPFQVADYIRHLKTYCKTGDYHLIYLAPRGKALNKNSAGDNYEEMLADGKLKLINYEEHIIDLVHRFAMHTDNERLRSFIKDFELKLRDNFTGISMIEENDIVKYIKTSEDNIRTAFSVARNVGTVKLILKDEFYRQMNDLAKELNLQFSEEHNHFVLPNFRKLYAKFNFESGGLIYGLVKTPEFNKFHPEKKFIPEISSKLKIQFSTSHWWPFHFRSKQVCVTHSCRLDPHVPSGRGWEERLALVKRRT
ncbi:MAG: hypothetical protein EOO20_18600 [Chryseobacterium sp.]|nr:MAG: hypothetical protein EOO20_18600 [Chryseobacterium sp.]